jgi:Protein of unknown function (DUF1360)
MPGGVVALVTSGSPVRMTTAPTDLPGNLGAEYAASADDQRPLAGYTVLTASFGVAMAGALLAARRSGRALPEQLGPQDVVMAGIATHKISRLIAKDKVTSFVRAPFTRFQEKAGHGELEEKVRGTGLRRAAGELLVCPYCLGQWISGGFAVGYVYAPRLTRLLAGMWTIHALADAAQLAYSAAEKRS